MLEAPITINLKTSHLDDCMSVSIDVLHDGAIFIQLYEYEQRALMDIKWINLIANIMKVIENKTVELKLNRVDVVPSYTSLLIQFEAVDHIKYIRDCLVLCLKSQVFYYDKSPKETHAILELPVYYGGGHGRDLQTVAENLGLSVAQVVHYHSEPIYYVFALGFSPGFAFMGPVDKNIRLPRRVTPRNKVLAGTVAIAENQTAVYPSESPGGWHGIGYCSETLFDVNRVHPSLFHQGQKVKFKPVTKNQLKIQKKVVNQKGLKDSTNVPAFKVITIQGSTQYVDLGRMSASYLGVSSSGPMDSYAYFWANHLLGNAANCVQLEIVWGGLSLLCLTAVDIAITGADLQAVIVRHDTKKLVVPWLAYRIQQGEILTFKGYCQKGLRAYLAVKNGFCFSYSGVFNSYSTVTKEKLGGRDNTGILLEKDELLEIKENTGSLNILTGVPYRYRVVVDNRALLVIKVRFCYQAYEMSTSILEEFLSQTYTLSQAMDRVAYRLEAVSPLLLHWDKTLNSEGIALGSIQITPAGEPIIMMRDRPTIGGYPKIAVISTKDINILAQAVAGQKIIFKEC